MKTIYEIRKYREEIPAKEVEYFLSHEETLEGFIRQLNNAIIDRNMSHGESLLIDTFATQKEAEQELSYYTSSISGRWSSPKPYHIAEQYIIDCVECEEDEDGELVPVYRDSVFCSEWDWTAEDMFNENNAEDEEEEEDE